MPRASEIAMEETRWEELTGLRIEKTEQNNFRVVRMEGGESLYIAATRPECRTYIQGYIQGNLDGIRYMTDKVFPESIKV